MSTDQARIPLKGLLPYNKNGSGFLELKVVPIIISYN